MKNLARGSLPRSWLSAIVLLLLAAFLNNPIFAASPETPNNLIAAVDAQTHIIVRGQGKGAMLQWSSSNPDIVAIDSSGTVTGVSEGAATIYCQITEDGNTTVLQTRVLVKPTIAVTNQSRLVEALSSGEYGRVVYQTDRSGEVVLLEGEYRDVELVVDTPNLSIVNYASFKNIVIEQISPNTWTEYAVGNRILITAHRSSLIVRDDARVSELVISNGQCNLIIHGKVDSIRANGVDRLALRGRANSAEIHGSETREIQFPSTLQISDTGDISVIKGNESNRNTSSGSAASTGASSSDRSSGGNSTVSSNPPSTGGGSSGGSGGGGTGSGGSGGDGSGGDGSNEGGSGGDGSGSEITVIGIAVKSQPDTTTYQTGEPLDLTGLAVTLNMSDGSSSEIAADQFASNGLQTTPAHGATLSTNNSSVTIRHQSGESSSFPISVTAPPPVPVTGISVSQGPGKVSYLEWAPLDLTGLVVTLELEDQTTVEVPFDAFASNGLSTTPAHGTALTLTHDEVEIQHLSGSNTSFVIQVNARGADTVQSLSVVEQPDITVYKDGEGLQLGGLIVALHYDDGVEWPVSYASFAQAGLVTSHTEGETLTESSNPIEVEIQHTPTGEITSFEVTVGPADLIGIEIASPPTKTEYIENEELDLSGLSVIFKYSNGNDSPPIHYEEFASSQITVSSEDDISGGLVPDGAVSAITVTVHYEEWSDSTQISVGKIKRIDVVSEPITTTYANGQLLNLDGLMVDIQYNILNGTQMRYNISYTEFNKFGIDVDPVHETPLEAGRHFAIFIIHDDAEIEDDMIPLDIQ